MRICLNCGHDNLELLDSNWNGYEIWICCKCSVLSGSRKKV